MDEKKKILADDLYKITISCLKLNDFLKTDDHGIIDIPWDGGGFKNGVHIVVSLQKKKFPCLYFCYSILQPTGECRDFEYKVDLDMTLPKYGGIRYWFRCPATILGCDRRVAVLYLVGDYFACRHCFNLTYKSRNSRGYAGLGVIDMGLVVASRDPRNWRYYKGKPTWKLRRYIKMDDKFKKSLEIFNARGDARLKKAQEKFEKLVQKDKRLIEESKKYLKEGGK